jgi:hypothetical protein
VGARTGGVVGWRVALVWRTIVGVAHCYAHVEGV